MKAVEILTGLTGGFFIELMFMWLTEKLVGHLLRSNGMKGGLLLLITARNIVTLPVFICAAMRSMEMMLSVGAGCIIYIYMYIVMKGIQIKKAV